jgi:peptidyl-tRNA hydrolase
LSGDFDRLRIGIGRPGREELGQDYASYVLANFTSLEAPLVDKTIELAAEAAAIWTFRDLAAAQRKVNVKPKKEEKQSKEKAEESTEESIE